VIPLCLSGRSTYELEWLQSVLIDRIEPTTIQVPL
jgi:hypothetical protein